MRMVFWRIKWRKWQGKKNETGHAKKNGRKCSKRFSGE